MHELHQLELTHSLALKYAKLFNDALRGWLRNRWLDGFWSWFRKGFRTSFRSSTVVEWLEGYGTTSDFGGNYSITHALNERQRTGFCQFWATSNLVCIAKVSCWRPSKEWVKQGERQCGRLLKLCASKSFWKAFKAREWGMYRFYAVTLLRNDILSPSGWWRSPAVMSKIGIVTPVW